MGLSGIKHNDSESKRSLNMSKFRLLKYFFVIVILVSYAGLVIFSISSNKEALQKDNYWDWYRSYVSQSTKGAFVNTGTKQDPIALSESQGYGMLITILAAQKGYIKEDQFMRLFHYYQANRISKTNTLMKWKQEKIKDGWSSIDQNNATDGDLDIAYALIQAEKLWPNSFEHYGEAAHQLITSIKTYNYSGKTGLLTVGNWATVDPKSETLIRSSDISPSYFKTFAAYTKDSFWTDLETNSIKALVEMSQQTETGLLPDFAWVGSKAITPVKPNEISGKNDGDYAYNAARVPYRLANSDDYQVKEVLDKMLGFLEKQPVVYGGYTLKGKALVDNQSSSFSAPILYATKDDRNYSNLYASQRWIFNAPIKGKDYYGDTLKTLVLMRLY